MFPPFAEAKTVRQTVPATKGRSLNLNGFWLPYLRALLIVRAVDVAVPLGFGGFFSPALGFVRTASAGEPLGCLLFTLD